MLEKGAISRIVADPEEGYISTVFLVPKKDGGQRPVFNLKRLNGYVAHQHFKMEGIHMLNDLLRKGDYMAKIDLKDAYFAVPMSQRDRKFLRFQWKGKTYQFNCLPFGLSCAPWVFTKITKAVTAVLREIGIRMIIYIDDILIMAESETLLKEHIVTIVYLLENLGFVINFPKSLLEPRRIVDILGFIVDSQSMELKLPGEKIKNIRGEARRILAAQRTTALELSRILGKMNAVTKAITFAPLFYRQLQSNLQWTLNRSNQSYKAEVELTVAAREELEWWIEHFSQWNGRSLISRKPNVVIETDASRKGWGAVCQGVRTGGPWSKEEQKLHINCLELLAAWLACKCFFKEERSINILLKIDNTSAVAYINKMGETVSPELNRINKSFWLWCMKRDISVQAQHLAGILNVTADAESREMRDRSDWMLCPELFRKISNRFGPLDVDLFASRLTTQLPSFVSWRPDPEAMATDAFTLDWKSLKGYANPPWNLIGKTLAQAVQQKAELVMVAPVWRAQSWYPLILELCMDYPCLIPRREETIQPAHPLAVPTVYPQLAVWNISGDNTKSNSFRRKLQNSYSHHGGKKTCKSYESQFQRWLGWCSTRGVNPISGPIEEVVNFLADLFAQGLQYRSLNAYRSAISSIHNKVDGCDVGQHPLVTRLLKGVFHQRPPQPRYSQTWDVGKVTTYVKALGDNNTMSLQALSHKLAMLLALTRPSRSADLAGLDLSYRSYSHEGVTFVPATLSKQSRQKKSVADFFFPRYTSDNLLCPVLTLKAYEERTKTIRGVHTRLFVGITKPHKPVCSSTIARWLKTLLGKAGVDTEIFKAHSVRSASTSAAAAAGVTTNDILAAADWSSEAVFQKFYHKPTKDGKFGKAVLNQT